MKDIQIIKNLGLEELMTEEEKLDLASDLHYLSLGKEHLNVKIFTTGTRAPTSKSKLFSREEAEKLNSFLNNY
jgi:hypothetical protein